MTVLPRPRPSREEDIYQRRASGKFAHRLPLRRVITVHHGNWNRMTGTFTLFPKFYQKLDLDSLAALTRECGFDAVDLVVREGYWCETGNLRTSATAFARTMNRAGLQVPLAIVSHTASELAANPDVLAILGDVGVNEIRFEHWRNRPRDTRGAMADARRDLERLAPLCEKHGVRALVQVHHERLVSSPTAAWQLVRDLPSRAIGVQLDAGNETREGFEAWPKATALLGEYFVSLGTKDCRPVPRADQGWSLEWCPLEQGLARWPALVRDLAAGGFNGLFDFHPFYAPDNDEERTRELKREVAYLRGLIAAVKP